MFLSRLPVVFCLCQAAEAGLQVNRLWEAQDGGHRGTVLAQPLRPHWNQKGGLSPGDMDISTPFPPCDTSFLKLHIKSSGSPGWAWGWCRAFSCTLSGLGVAGVGQIGATLTGPGSEAQGICPVPSGQLCGLLAADKAITKAVKVFQEAAVTPFPQEDHLLSFCD